MVTIVHPIHGVVWFEVKGPRGKPSPDQVEWIDDLRTAGQHAYIVYPRDVEFVEVVLRGQMSLDDAVALLTGELA